ncbi:MAG: fumarylacetoacetate hydrolase family protein [Opitutales bacterium]
MNSLVLSAKRIGRHLNAEGQPEWIASLAEDGPFCRVEGDPFSADAYVTDQAVNLGKLRAPVTPSAIYGVGLNYRAHAAETGREDPQHPLIFMKAPSAVAHPGDPIVLPRHLRSDQVDPEAELALVIGKTARNVAPEAALDCLLGFTCANDVSARDWQFEWGSGQFCRGKTFDTFCPLGPIIVPPRALGDYTTRRVRQKLNGEVVQDGSLSELIFSVEHIIAFLSGSTTLLPGTVILTGTPAGVGQQRNPPRYARPGDVIDIEIDGIGTLTNSVVEES